MKKFCPFIPALALVVGMSTNCVENNPYVVLNGVVVHTCDPTSEDQQVLGIVKCMPTEDMCREASFFLNVRNNISSTSGWSSNSSSSTGSAFEPNPPNRGLVYMKKITTNCYSIDGEKDNCKGKSSFTQSVNAPVKSGGGVCIPYLLDISEISSWGAQDSVVLEVYIEYANAGGLIKDKTSHSLYTISNVAMECPKNPFLPEVEKPEDETNKDNPNDDNSGKEPI